jgi:hypothetical protein
MTRSTLRWPALALIGLLVAATVAFLAIRTVSVTIGISSEPLSAGKSLAPEPPHRERPHRRDDSAAAPRPPATAAPIPTTTTTTTYSPPPAPSGGGRGGAEAGAKAKARPNAEANDD